MTDAFDRLTTEQPDIVPDQRTIEETLLVALFTSPEAVARIVGETRPTDFIDADHRRLASYLYPALNEGRHVDLVTLRDTVTAQEDEERTAKLLDTAGAFIERAQGDAPSLGKVEEYLAIFLKRARLGDAQRLIAATQAKVAAGDLSPEAGVAGLLNAWADLDVAGRFGAFHSEGEEIEAFFADLTSRQTEGDFIGLDTGFAHLNHVINGLVPGTLTVLGAAPSLGKTTLAKQIVDNIVEKHADAAVLFVSLEQSKEELRIKTLSRWSGIENRDILRGRLAVKEAGWQNVERAKERYARVADRMFVLEGDRNTTVDRLRLAVMQVRQATGAQHVAVVVDYLQIVPTEEPFRDKRLRVEYVTSELRRIARELNVAVIAIASLGREAYERAGIDVFKESGDIEYSADVALVLTKPKDDDPTQKTRKSYAVYAGDNDQNPIKVDSLEGKLLILHVVKNRNGEKDKAIRLYFFDKVSAFLPVE